MFGKPTTKELPIPAIAAKDAKSFEILRIWIANGNQHFCLKSMAWDDPAAWGLMLADVARHVAKSYQRDAGLDEAEALQRIRQGLEAEFASPTDSSN